MAHLLPKRTSELCTLDSDTDTPDKRNENKNSYRLPKRVADLDLQESDSEEEKNDNLNFAQIDLNDSFIISPSKKLDFDDSIQPLRTQNENTKPTARHAEDNGYEKSKDQGDQLKIHSRPLKSRQQLFPQEKITENSVSMPSVFQKFHKNEPENVAPSQNDAHEQNKTAEIVSKPAEIETPFKKADQAHVFVTPSVRAAPFSFASTAAKRSQNLPLQPLSDRKDKPQAKILFTTPIARPPPGSLVENTPIVTLPYRKLSPIKEPSTEKEKPDERIVTIKNVDYVIEKKIGSGGSSSVFLARGKYSNKEFAIKLVNLSGDQQIIDGYLNETKLLAKLQGNKSVVSLFDYCHLPSKNILYMVMEKGESDLHKTLQSFKTHIPLYTLLSYWYQMLQAVNYIHQNGVIHSDLKPANFLMISGRLKLIDFGIASNIALDSTSIIKFSQAGTFNYISPEALIDTSSGDSPSTHHQPKIRLSTKSDVWSLGCIFYLLLFKKTPFSHIKIIHQKITVLTNPNTVIEYPELPNIYPPILVEMVRKCLVYNPKERSSVADLLKYPFDMMIPIEQ